MAFALIVIIGTAAANGERADVLDLRKAGCSHVF
jgi:hypothetical protein